MNKNSVTDRDGEELVGGGSGELAKTGTAKWRLMLMGATCLVGVDLAATPSAAVSFYTPPPLPESPTEPWRVNTSRPCTTDVPGDWEVFIYVSSPASGECAALKPGLYPYPWNLGLPDNSISMVKVGKNVRAILFEHPVYKGTRSAINGCLNGQTVGCGGGKNLDEKRNNRVSSMRVEINNPGPTNCPRSSLKVGEIALYSNRETSHTDGSDCIVLPTLHPDSGDEFNHFASPEVMGIANDSIARIELNKHLNGTCLLAAFSDENYEGKHHDFVPSKPEEWLDVSIDKKQFLYDEKERVYGEISSIKIFCP